jgi:hypothetical protein
LGGDPDHLAYPPSGHDPDCPLTLYFPREISQLRVAYQKDVASTGPQEHNSVRDILPSYSDIPGSEDDTVAPYSRRQGPMSQEGVMLGVVSELKKHSTQYVLVRATDPMDTLFLVRYLRTAYPQGRVVTLGADMLFRREAEDPRFHGLLSLSTYSLATTANEGFKVYEEQHAERIFPSTSEAGLYNAMRSLLVAWADGSFPCSFIQKGICRLTLIDHLDKTQHPLDLYQYGWRQQPRGDGRRAANDPVDPSLVGYDAPPVRLLALGRDQYWPLAALGPFVDEKPLSLLPRASDQLIGSPPLIDIPHSWHVVQLIGLGLVIFFCWSLWQSSIFRRLQPFARFAPAMADRRLTLILVAGLTLLFVLAILLWPALHGARSTGWALEPLLLLAALAVFLTTTVEGFSRAVAWCRAMPPAANEGPAPEPLLLWATTATFVKASIQRINYAVARMRRPVPLSKEAPTKGAVTLPPVPALRQDASAQPESASKDGAAVRLARERAPETSPVTKTLRERLRARRVSYRTRATRTASMLRPFLQVGLFLVCVFKLPEMIGKPESVQETSALIRFYSTLRTVQLSSGLSFIIPIFFFLTVWLWWAEQLSSGYTLLDNRCPRLPMKMQEKRVLPLAQEGFPELCANLNPSPFRLFRYLLIASVPLLVTWFLMGWRHTVLSLEKPVLERMMTYLFLLAITGIVVTTVQTWEVWLSVRTLLVQLDMFPLRDAFKGIEGFSWKPIWRFGTGSLAEFLRIFSRNREAMERAINTLPELATCRDALDNQLERVMDVVKKTKKTNSLWHWWTRRRKERETVLEFGRYQELAAQVAGKALDFLGKHWESTKEEQENSRFEALVPWRTGDDRLAVLSKLDDEEEDSRIRGCERFVCMSYTNFLMVMLVRIRTLIVAISGMYVLTLVGISQYPFEPLGALQLLLVVLLVFVVSVVGMVFAQIHRDTILSNLTDTKPGELGIDFYIRMAAFVALPLFSLLASQFPSINRLFYSWLQPAIEALNR